MEIRFTILDQISQLTRPSKHVVQHYNDLLPEKIKNLLSKNDLIKNHFENYQSDFIFGLSGETGAGSAEVQPAKG